MLIFQYSGPVTKEEPDKKFRLAQTPTRASVVAPKPTPFTDIVEYSRQKGSPILVDPVYASSRNFTGKILDGYAASKACASPLTIDKLIEVNKYLKQFGLQLLIKDGYRPAQASLDMVRYARDNGHNDWVGPYVAEKSGHNSGRNIDLTLATLDGREVWMGSVFDEFNKNAHFDRSRPHTSADDKWALDGRYHVDSKRSAAELRQILQDAMGSAGFQPYNKDEHGEVKKSKTSGNDIPNLEWWHFTDFRLPSKSYKNPIE
ncbi:hypothetical protein HY988_01375 [Candidatus Micrarchaeota archaeon]|nr:hypothetical protein [Candidatus Micrarchaeota archaeon]